MLYSLACVAPEAEIKAMSISDPPQDAVEQLFDDLGCRVISCSWGWEAEQVTSVLEATLQDLAAEDALLVFAAGNGQHAWPGSMPDVLSIGGVYQAPGSRDIEASSFASGFLSTRYPGRTVPDVCGLCGHVPRGIYLMLPTQPASRLDREHGGSAFVPDGYGDDTRPDDGWVGASGTSSATAQVAGVVALMLEAAAAAGAQLSSLAVRTLLAATCRVPTKGRNAMGVPASPVVPNASTGYGLVNVEALLSRMLADGIA
jgi:subtilisin family serine protease